MTESTNNVKYAGDGKFIPLSVCQKLWTQNVDWQSLWKKWCSFFASQGRVAWWHQLQGKHRERWWHLLPQCCNTTVRCFLEIISAHFYNVLCPQLRLFVSFFFSTWRTYTHVIAFLTVTSARAVVPALRSTVFQLADHWSSCVSAFSTGIFAVVPNHFPTIGCTIDSTAVGTRSDTDMKLLTTFTISGLLRL